MAGCRRPPLSRAGHRADRSSSPAGLVRPRGERDCERVAGCVGSMSAPVPEDPLAELNRVLSDVIDAIREVKQAEWKVPKAHELHADLDRLFSDLVTWKSLLSERDAALGVSPLAFMPTVEGRAVFNLWPGDPTDEEVRTVVDQHLELLEDHVSRARTKQRDEGSESVLAQIQSGVATHRRTLRKAPSTES
jgi:DNA-binding ferritin-like protein